MSANTQKNRQPYNGNNNQWQRARTGAAAQPGKVRTVMDTLLMLDWQTRKDWALLRGYWNPATNYCKWSSPWLPVGWFIPASEYDRPLPTNKDEYASI